MTGTLKQTTGHRATTLESGSCFCLTHKREPQPSLTGQAPLASFDVILQLQGMLLSLPGSIRTCQEHLPAAAACEILWLVV